QDTHKNHQENAIELRSIIAASELVPKFVELIGNVQGQAGATSGSITRTRIEEIIGAATFSSAVNSISRTFARMTEIDSLYLRIVEKCLACSRDLQFAAITPILAIALGFLFENNLDLSTASLLTLTLSYGVAIGFKVIYDLS